MLNIAKAPMWGGPPAAGGGGTVVFDAAAGAVLSGGGATTLDHTTLTIGSGTNRALTAILQFDNKSVSGVTMAWDPAGTNQALTLIGTVSNAGANGRTEVWGLVAPTSGNKTLRASWTGGSQCAIGAVSWTGVDQTGGTTSFPNFNSATGTGTTASVTITSGTGHAVIAGHVNTSGSGMSAVNNTSLHRITYGLVIDFGANYQATGSASIALTATIGSNGWGSAGCDIAPA